MKKSLVITTIATVLVIVVALTTATFAWFSSSSSNTVSSGFQAQTSNAVFTFYPYLSGQSGYDYANGQSTLDLSQYTDTTDVNGKTAIFTTTEMKAYVPKAIIAADTPTEMTGTWAGLPGAQFYTAQQSATNAKSLTGAYATPTKYDDAANGASLSNAGLANVARFELSNGKSDAKNVDIVVTITGQGNSPDIAVAEAMRFVVIGVPKGDNAGKKFIVGTEYVCDGLPSAIESAWSNSFNAEEYTAVNNASYATFTGGGGYANLSAVKKMNNNPNATLTYSFPFKIDGVSTSGITVTNGESYEIYLYIWLDGSKITDGGSGGAVQFAIDFKDSKGNGGSEYVGG